MSVDQEKQEVKNIVTAVIPTRLELIFIPLSCLLFLSFLAALEYFQTTDGNNYEIVAQNIESYVRSFLALFDRYLGITFLTLIFWMLVGTIVYSIIWIAASTYTAYKNDMPRTRGIIFPRGYKKSSIVHEAIAKISIRTAAVITLGFWLYIFLTKILPYSTSEFLSPNYQSTSKIIIQSIISVLLIAISTFVIFVLCRLTLLRTRVFYK